MFKKNRLDLVEYPTLNKKELDRVLVELIFVAKLRQLKEIVFMISKESAASLMCLWDEKSAASRHGSCRSLAEHFDYLGRMTIDAVGRLVKNA